MQYTIMGVLSGLIILLLFRVSNLCREVKSIDNKVASLPTQLDGHTRRIDHLFQMFINLLNETKK